MTPNQPRSAGGTLSPRFSCQRCKPQHSIGMGGVYKVVAVKLKDVKLTEREHKILVVTKWHEFKKDHEGFDEALRHIAALKGTNKTDIEACEERLKEMKCGDKKAPQKDIAVEMRKWERLDQERESLLNEREKSAGRVCSSTTISMPFSNSQKMTHVTGQRQSQRKSAFSLT